MKDKARKDRAKENLSHFLFMKMLVLQRTNLKVHKDISTWNGGK